MKTRTKEILSALLVGLGATAVGLLILVLCAALLPLSGCSPVLQANEGAARMGLAHNAGSAAPERPFRTAAAIVAGVCLGLAAAQARSIWRTSCRLSPQRLGPLGPRQKEGSALLARTEARKHAILTPSAESKAAASADAQPVARPLHEQPFTIDELKGTAAPPAVPKLDVEDQTPAQHPLQRGWLRSKSADQPGDAR